MRKIEVIYDIRYPRGLTIKVDNIEIYKKDSCCIKTEFYLFEDEDEEDDEPITKLTWKDANDFDEEIREEVQKVLDNIYI